MNHATLSHDSRSAAATVERLLEEEFSSVVELQRREKNLLRKVDGGNKYDRRAAELELGEVRRKLDNAVANTNSLRSMAVRMNNLLPPHRRITLPTESR
jgi:hypothetical protein